MLILLNQKPLKGTEMATDIISHFSITKQEEGPQKHGRTRTQLKYRLAWFAAELKSDGFASHNKNNLYMITKRGINLIKDNKEYVEPEFINNYKKHKKIAVSRKLGKELGNSSSLEKPSEEKLKILTDEYVRAIHKNILKDFYINKDVLATILAHLVGGKNILLVGPIGSGKTHLARILPSMVFGQEYSVDVYTATAEWTEQDVIGGIFPKVHERKDHETNVSNEITYDVQLGCVSKTVKDTQSKKNKINKKSGAVWLVIDEFNRANIDRAFGQLFTSLEIGKLKIPTTKPNMSYEELLIPANYRIIGTLNTADKHFLHTLSDALKRRFAIVEIQSPPNINEELSYVFRKILKEFEEDNSDDSVRKFIEEPIRKTLKIKKYGDPIIEDIKRAIEPYTKLDSKQNPLETRFGIFGLYDVLSFIRRNKPLGTELLISMSKFILLYQYMTGDKDKSVDLALTTTILPQIESLPYQTLEVIHASLNGITGSNQELFQKTDLEYKHAKQHLLDYLKLDKDANVEDIRKSISMKKYTGKLQSFCNGIASIIRKQNPYYEESVG